MSFGFDMHVNIPLKMYNNAANVFSSNLNTHKTQNTWGVDILPHESLNYANYPGVLLSSTYPSLGPGINADT